MDLKLIGVIIVLAFAGFMVYKFIRPTNNPQNPKHNNGGGTGTGNGGGSTGSGGEDDEGEGDV